MKIQNIILMTLTTGLLTSCQLYKNYERPASIQAEGIYGGAQSGDSLGLGDLKWRDIFTDPQLQTLVEKTLAQNTNMQQADLAIQEAEAALRCAKLAYIPSFTVSPTGRLTKVLNSDQGLSKIYEVPLTASWQLGSAGNLRNNKKKAQVALEQTKVAKQAIQTQLVSTVATLYYNLAMLDENLAISQQTLVNWKKTLDVTKAYMQAGGANAAAVSSTEASVYSIESNIIDLKASIHTLENSLNSLMGERPGHISRAALSSWQTPAAVTTGIPCRILQRRPDVKQAELNLASKFYDKNLALSNFFPALNLTGSLDWTNSLGAMIVNPGKIIAAGIASITQPLFRNGALRAQYKISQLEMESASLAFQQTLIDAGNEVNTAMADIQAAEAKRPLLANQVASLQRAVEATQQLWAINGSATYIQILTAQTQLLSSQMGEVNNRMDIISNTIALYQALGGGTE